MTENNKRVYQIDFPEDFKLVKGFLNHLRRCSENKDTYGLSENEYLDQCCAREYLLLAYNAAIIGTAVGGLVSLLK